jgi:hypothetical protein
VIFQNEPIFSWFSGGDVFTELRIFTSQATGFGQARELNGEVGGKYVGSLYPPNFSFQ